MAVGFDGSGVAGTPQLRRVLTTRDLVAFGVMMMFPLAPIAVYAAVSGSTAGHMAGAYLVAMVAMLFTALSYGAMAGAFPRAGSTYTFTRNGLNQYAGLLAGWAIMLDYLLFPALNFIIIAAFAQQLAGTVGAFGGWDYWVWVIAAIAVPARSVSKVSPSPKNGFVERTVPAPAPPLRVPLEATTNHAMTIRQTTIRIADTRASHLTSMRLKTVTTTMAATTQNQ